MCPHIRRLLFIYYMPVLYNKLACNIIVSSGGTLLLESSVHRESIAHKHRSLLKFPTLITLLWRVIEYLANVFTDLDDFYFMWSD